MARVLVVGGGVSGLAAAHRLRTRLGPDADIVVVEAARSLGGKLAAVELGGRRVDVGAEAFLARRPEAAGRASPSSASPTSSCTPAPRPPPARRRAHRRAARRARSWACPATPTPPPGALSPAGLAALRADRPGAVGARRRRRGRARWCARGWATRWPTGSSTRCSAASTPGSADGLGVRATVPALAAAPRRRPAARCSPPPGSCLPGPAARARARPGVRHAARRARRPPRHPRPRRPRRAAPGPHRHRARAHRHRLARRVRRRTGRPVEADAVVLAVPAPAVRRLLADHAPAAARAAGRDRGRVLGAGAASPCPPRPRPRSPGARAC